MQDHSLPASPQDAAASPGRRGGAEGHCALGVLFVHGIGAQARGQTLAEFGGPVFRWLEDRFRGLGRRWRHAGLPEAELQAFEERLERWRWAGEVPPPEAAGRMAELAATVGTDVVAARAVLSDTRFADAEDSTAPAHTELEILRLRYAGAPDRERWLLAESWWAESFAPPRFGDFARWGLRIVPWTFGAHFGARVRRRWGERPRNATPESATAKDGRLRRTGRWLRWAWRLFAAAIGLLLGLLASLLLLAALALLLAVALIPVPQIRSALASWQRRIASTIGDSFVLLDRPVEAASIVGQVRRDLTWLAARCRVVAVVAHSQGGAVVHEALRGGLPPKLRLLFTFGSGLRKLEELRELMTSGRSLRFSAALTLVALVFLLFFGLGFTLLLTRSAGRDLAELGLLGGYVLLSSIVLVAGVWDHLEGVELPALKRWIRALKSRSSLDWVDCYASADPVSNGPLDPEVTDSPEVCNRASLLRDHTDYWSNRDEFLSLLVDRLAAPRLRDAAGLPAAPELAADGDSFYRLAARRRWRVGLGRAVGWIAILSLVFALARTWTECLLFARWSAGRALAWAAGLVGSEVAPPPQVEVAWRAVGLLALPLVAWWIVGKLWTGWNDAEMRAAVERFGRADSPPFGVLVGIWVQAIIALFLAAGSLEAVPGWLFVLPLFVLSVFALIRRPPLPNAQRETRSAAPADRRLSRGERASKNLWRLASELVGVAAIAYWVWKGSSWILRRLAGGSSLGPLQEWIPLALGALVAVAWAVWSWREQRARPRRPPATGTDRDPRP